MSSGLYPLSSIGSGIGSFGLVHSPESTATGRAPGAPSFAPQKTVISGRVGYTEEELQHLLRAQAETDAALAPERAYVAAGRQYARSLEASEASASFAGLFGAMQPGGGVQAAASLPGPGRADLPETGESGGRMPARRNDAAGQDSGLLSGGIEARSAGRTFIGGGSDASSAGRQQGRNSGGADGGEEGAGARELTAEEEQVVREMESRDREVRTHEQAHLSSGGGLVSGGATYQKERGPDGKMYAVGGEVRIDSSEGATPSETISRARRVKAAALAPAEPSAQDRQVAAQAAQMEATARQEQVQERREEADPSEKGGADADKAQNPDGPGTGSTAGLAAADADKSAGGEREPNRGLAAPAGWERELNRGLAAYRQSFGMMRAYTGGSVLSSVA